ncbi:MAG: glutamine synthetase [Acidimicrobiia bacterium]|nr:glutamine synthetase [Acidimicrobiia bacterium]
MSDPTASGLDGVSWVSLTFVDVFGLLNSVQLPAERFDAAVSGGEPFDGSALEGRARYLEADMLLRPDPRSVMRLGDGLARAVCDVVTVDGRPWPGDPRTALEATAASVADLADQWTGAAELEFYLLTSDGAPVDRAGYFDDVGEGPGTATVRRAADRLRGCGLEVDACHHEAGPGQYELDLAALGPVALPDALVFAKQVVKETAAHAGLRATFMPRPFDGEPGSGLHLHQRVDGLVVDAELGEDGRAFVAGQLAHARGLSALAAPTVNSYKRLHSGAEAPGAVVWAHKNRAALIRLGSSRGGEASIEYRGADPSANPYLLVAGLLASAAHGLEAELELAPPLEEDVGTFDPASADAIRYEPLPRDLDDALDALLADDLLADTFDRQLLSRLVDGRRAEAEEYRAHVTGWEVERYRDEA